MSNLGSWDLTTAFPGAGYYSGVSNTPTAGDIKRGTALLGVTGGYPSATHPLLRYSDTGASTTEVGSDETDLNVFAADAGTAGTYEYWNSSGQRLTGTSDSNLSSENILDNVPIYGVTGTAFIGSPIISSIDTSPITQYDITWNNNSFASGGYILLRSTSLADAQSISPVNGTFYADSDTLGGQDVIYSGSATSYDDTDVGGNPAYFYTLFAFNSGYIYSQAHISQAVPSPRGDCQDIYNTGDTTSGIYTIDPDGSGGNPSYNAYCNQTDEGGGWTLAYRFISSSTDAEVRTTFSTDVNASDPYPWSNVLSSQNYHNTLIDNHDFTDYMIVFSSDNASANYRQTANCPSHSLSDVYNNPWASVALTSKYSCSVTTSGGSVFDSFLIAYITLAGGKDRDQVDCENNDDGDSVVWGFFKSAHLSTLATNYDALDYEVDSLGGSISIGISDSACSDSSSIKDIYHRRGTYPSSFNSPDNFVGNGGSETRGVYLLYVR